MEKVEDPLLEDHSSNTTSNEHEEVSQLVSINLICRLCANQIQNNKLIGIYSEDGINNDLANKMNMYLPIKVSDNDDLPQQCCWDCASTVLAWHDLFVASVEADRRLRNCELYSYQSREGVAKCGEVGNKNEDKADEECLKIADKEIKNVKEEVKPSLDLNTDFKPANLVPLYDSQQTDSNSLKKYSNEVEESDKLKDFSDSEQNFNYGCQFCSVMFVTEEETINHINESHADEIEAETSSSSQKPQSNCKKRKKDKRKNNKIDQELVNAAKVVVDGRAYYSCKECGKSLHSPYTYVWHMRIHTGERPFVCDLCGKQFRVSQGLVRHLKETHEGIKNFACDLCGRMFATRRNVVEHRRIHTNERPYVCNFCGKAFKQKASLFVHNRSHSDVFPFKCPHCPQVFRTKPPLLLHITRHTGEKPYPCDICGRVFRIKYELKRHRLIHSDEKPFSCEECGLSFRQKRYLRNHNKVNHPQTVS